MATEFNYVVGLNTSRIAGAAAEIRSQLGMALSGATGFNTPAGNLPGGGFTGPSQLSDFSGGVSQGMGQMLGSFGAAGPQGNFGGTFTNPAIANVPHYGVPQIEFSLEQERLLTRGGLGRAYMDRPPGVGAGEYFVASQASAMERQLNANSSAWNVAASTFGSVALGMAGGSLVNSLVEKSVAPQLTGMLGKFGVSEGMAKGLGKVGAFAAGWMAFDYANDYIGKQVQDYYADIEKTKGQASELGNIVGFGRGLKSPEQVGLGFAALDV